MKQATVSSADNYTILFFLTWVVLYLLFPAWISMHETFASRGLTASLPLARTLVILGFVTYFSASAFLMGRYIKALDVSEPVVAKVRGWSGHIRNHAGLAGMCSVAAALHLPALPTPELGYLHQGLWMYDFFGGIWKEASGFPVQYFFWTAAVLLIFLMSRKSVRKYLSESSAAVLSVLMSDSRIKLLSIIVLFGAFSLYAYFFPYYDRIEALRLLRFPPVSKFLYFITYCAFGINYVGPKIIQLSFYLLAAVYLYRTILLYRDRETALLGATIYLFSPIIFFYASLTFLASGTIFFMILISYYFLRFMKYEGSRDLILTSYFIGVGFLYKRVILVMLIICFGYLVLSRIKKRNLKPLIHFKILFLSLIPVLPWMKIGVLDVYEKKLFELISLKSLITYLMILPDQISTIMFVLLFFSLIYMSFAKRDILTLYFGFYFIVFYFFFTLKNAGQTYHRYAMSFYPAIAVFLALGMFHVSQKIKFKYAYKVVFLASCIYLIILNITPGDKLDLVTYKYNDFETQLYPYDKATDWISGSAGKDEKVLSLFMTNYQFYVERMSPAANDIGQDRILYLSTGSAKELISPLENLKDYCRENSISYIMFPHSPRNTYTFGASLKESTYLKEGLDKDSAFMEVARFNLGDNFIIIYELDRTSRNS